MNQKHITIVVKDGGIDKTFIISKFKATKALYFVFSLFKLLSTSDKFNLDAIKQFIFNSMESGIQIEGVKNKDIEEVANLLTNNKLEVLFDLFKSILASWDYIQQEELLSNVLPCIALLDGGNSIRLNLIENSTEHIDHYINDFKTLITLIWEVIKFNYLGFFLK